MLFLKKIKNFWCCHKNIVVLWQNKEEWQLKYLMNLGAKLQKNPEMFA